MAEVIAQGLLASNHVSAIEQASLTGVPASWLKGLSGTKGWSEVTVGYGRRISTHRTELNLWKQPNKAQIVLSRYQWMALFIVALFMFGNLSWLTLYQRSLPLRQEVQQLALQGAKIEAQVKHQKELEVAWNTVKINTDKIGDGLGQIQATQALPGADPKINQVLYKQGSLSLVGSAMDANSVESLIRTLRNMGWEQPALSSYKLTALNNVEFSLSAKRGRVELDPDSTLGEEG